jgi:outer membrane beta-barrel protein
VNKQLVLIAVVLFALTARAQEVVEIPEEELARESVLPIFDTPDVVKSRLVTLTKKIEFGAFFGMNVNEAFYDQLLYGAQASYHLTEMSAIGVMFSMINAQSSQYVPQLNEVSTPPLHYELLPKPKYFFLLNYEFTPFYGKMSVTKQTIINLTTFCTLGLGMFALGDSQTPLLGIGVGQNFFFGKSWGLKIDMRGLIYQGIDPVSVDVNSYGGQTPPVSDYQRQTVVNFTVSGGLIVLL